MKTFCAMGLWFFLSALLSLPASAETTWTVDPAGQGDFTTLQGCIDAFRVRDGDLCLADPGVYTENISFRGKGITLQSAQGAETTIIDGGLAGSTVTFNSGEGSDSVLDGFTVRGGSGTWVEYLCLGGGIFLAGASPEIRNCIISGNTVAVDRYFALGGGIGSLHASPTVRDCIIRENVTTGVGANGTGGGGIFILGGNPEITGCRVLDNQCRYGEETLGGGLSCLDASPAVVNCLIARNRAVGDGVYVGGGGVFLSMASPEFLHCTITENRVEGNGTYQIGGGVLLVESSRPNVRSSILWADHAAFGPEFHFLDDSVPVVNHSDIQMENPSDLWPGEGNMNQAPCFSREPGYHLALDSPCVDRADGNVAGLPETDLDGQPRRADGDCDSELVADMGADELPVLCPWPSVSTLGASPHADRDLRNADRINAMALLALPPGLLLLRMVLRRRRRGPC